jgi:uncharacterized damage-inducible protein DinB
MRTGLFLHFQMLAQYNRVANERMYERCSYLEAAEYLKQREGSFGSIHGLLNHLLLADRIWMARFEGEGKQTPPLDTILFDDFENLWSARREEDIRIEEYFKQLSPDFMDRSFHYTNSQVRPMIETAQVAVAHFFNHQTHHRGQLHVMLSQTPVPPPSVDLHRIMNP